MCIQTVGSLNTKFCFWLCQELKVSHCHIVCPSVLSCLKHSIFFKLLYQLSVSTLCHTSYDSRSLNKHCEVLVSCSDKEIDNSRSLRAFRNLQESSGIFRNLQKLDIFKLIMDRQTLALLELLLCS